MRNRFLAVAGLGGLLIAACSSDNGQPNPSDDGGGAAHYDSSIDHSMPSTHDGPTDTAQPGAEGGVSLDGGLGCCPTGYSLYQCQRTDGTMGLACHNPQMGCASSQTCGAGCDPQVSGRCGCVQTELCVVGDHFDPALCKCVPNADAAIDGGCVQTELCVVGDHFDRQLCKCVPNADAAVDGGCVQTELCVVGDHFDRQLCKCVPNTDAAVDGGCVQTVLCIVGDHFDRQSCRCVPNADAALDGGCIDTILCRLGTHFDRAACTCVADARDGGAGCTSAAECTGALPALCEVCSNGTSGCAHFACVGGQCTIAYCP